MPSPTPSQPRVIRQKPIENHAEICDCSRCQVPPELVRWLHRYGNWPSPQKYSRPGIRSILWRLRQAQEDRVLRRVISWTSYPFQSGLSTVHDLADTEAKYVLDNIEKRFRSNRQWYTLTEARILYHAWLIASLGSVPPYWMSAMMEGILHHYASGFYRIGPNLITGDKNRNLSLEVKAMHVVSVLLQHGAAVNWGSWTTRVPGLMVRFGPTKLAFLVAASPSADNLWLPN